MYRNQVYIEQCCTKIFHFEFSMNVLRLHLPRINISMCTGISFRRGEAAQLWIWPQTTIQFLRQKCMELNH